MYLGYTRILAKLYIIMWVCKHFYLFQIHLTQTNGYKWTFSQLAI